MDRIDSLRRINAFRLSFCALISLLALAPRPADAATAYRVADLSNVRRGIGSNPVALGLVGNRALFTSSRGGLIVSNGTNAGTQEFLVGNFFESLGSAGSRHYLLQSVFEIVEGQLLSLKQPWITDGTAAGTFSLAPSVRAPQDLSRTRLFHAVPGTSRAFFGFNDGTHGEELWVSDGTRAGTHLVADLVAGGGGSFPTTGLWLADAGRLLFAALDPTEGWRLWVTDGTSAGTRVVRDFVTGTSEASGFPQALLTRNGAATVLVRAAEGLTLWTTDGTGAGTVQILGIPTWSTISRSLVAGGRLYFFGRDPQTDDDELWVTDGTSQGTQRLTNFGEPRPIGHTGDLRAVATDRGIAFFATDGPSGNELWVSDGTAAGTRVVDACVGPCDGVDQFLAPAPGFHRGRVYWSVDAEVGAGVELFVSDALGGGLERLGNLCSGPCNLPYRFLTGAGPRVYFMASEGGHRSLWRTSGTAASTARLNQFDDTFLFNEGRLVALGGNLLFANFRMATGAELWVSNGRANGTRLLRDFAPGDFGGSMPRNFMASANRAFFLADDGVHGVNQLWTSDGTPAGTRFLTSLPQPEFGSFRIFSWQTAGNRVVFLLDGLERTLWASDGTATGTRNLLPAGTQVRSSQLAAIGSRVYFVAQQGSESAPWVTDGTVAGTRRLAMPEPLITNSGNFIGTPRGDVLFTESSEGGFPWFVLSPTGGAARPLSVVYPFLNERIANGVLGGPVVIGNKLYFALRDRPSDSTQLWEFDFTARRARSVGLFEGVDSIINFATLSTDGSRIWISLFANGFWRWNGGSSLVVERITDPVTLIAAIGGKLYGKGVLDGAQETSLLVGDGSRSGSVPVRDPSGRPILSREFDRLALSPLGNSAVCLTPQEVWATNGTPAQTSRLHEFDLAPFSSSPPELVTAGNRVFFRGWDPEAGFELWAVRAGANGAD